ncbi:hypothetical protein ASC77_22800 [Nocardioides sp. Root1257]|uniref:hypothetical protein n=1 Tax=unclassified Nocardioides TaxID=2615069 RepID=UPI0006F88E5E|nr:MULTISPECIES: hypothetical protein [unclassified Nocardioides]KQW43115.1 hypothetical protein ASC77_22800 [Nocardioides sp. Root1257]KRC41983.1 hypothetical protein ASE24_22590 [Nocardioides sp. Root224]
MRTRHLIPVAALSMVLAGIAGAQALTADSAAPRGGSRPASYGYVAAQVFTAPGLGSVAVGMPNPSVVKIQHRRAGATSWDTPSVLFAGKGRVTCGEIDGAVSPGGIALTLECDRPYYEDEAPVHTRALVSRDLVSWSRHELPGEAYQAPAISPDGRTAAWPAGGGDGFVRWRAGSGFSRLIGTGFHGDGGAETIVAEDSGTVSVMGAEARSGKCRLGVHARPLTGPEQVQLVDGVAPGCTEGSLTTVDDLTVRGDGSSRATTYVVSRPDTASLWRLTAARPVDGAGLVVDRGSPRKVIYPTYLDVAGKPLLSIGSPDRQRLMVQTYDDVTRTWSSRSTVYDHGFPGCTGGDSTGDATSQVYVLELHCYAHARPDGTYPPYDRNYDRLPHGRTLLLSADGTTWTAAPIGPRPYAVNASASLVAAPGRHATRIVSPTGITTVPVTAEGRCDLVFPVAANRLLRLHGGPHARWPSRVQLSTGTGWHTVDTIAMPSRGRCQRVYDENDLRPTLFNLVGGTRGVSLTVRRGGPEGWRVVRTPERY